MKEIRTNEEFEKALNEASALRADIERMENTANVTRDFPSSMAFFETLGGRKTALAQVNYAIKRYQENQK